MVVKDRCTHPPESMPPADNQHDRERLAAVENARERAITPWYSLTETAALLGISRPTVVRLIARGDLPGERIGRRWYVPRELVDRIGYPDADNAA